MVAAAYESGSSNLAGEGYPSVVLLVAERDCRVGGRA